MWFDPHPDHGCHPLVSLLQRLICWNIYSSRTWRGTCSPWPSFWTRPGPGWRESRRAGRGRYPGRSAEMIWKKGYPHESSVVDQGPQSARICINFGRLYPDPKGQKIPPKKLIFVMFEVLVCLFWKNWGLLLYLKRPSWRPRDTINKLKFFI